MKFDPFGDFDARGYLRNFEGAKNPDQIKELEHLSFTSNLKDALLFLSGEKTIEYKTFLRVHEIIFSDVYPWAGKDRFELAPNLDISKGRKGAPGYTEFEKSYQIESAINYGLSLASKKGGLKSRPGQVMGNFAFAHPFLDGNGRTLTLVHMELCHRNGFSIEWSKTQKNKYLIELSREINEPRNGALDSYLCNFISEKLDRNNWRQEIMSINGLSGSYDNKKPQTRHGEDISDLTPIKSVTKSAYQLTNK